MSVLVLFLAICTWTANAASTGASDGLLFRPDYTYDNEAGGWLKFHPIPLKWSQAALRCHHEGAILASPLNEGLSRALGAIMEVHGITSSPVFTGTGAIYTTNEYQSMEGVPISDMCLTWAAEPPFTESTRYCIAMNANGTVTAVPCTDHHPFFCYRKKGVSVLNKCGTVDPEYVFNLKTGSCYKTSKQRLSWEEAYTSCATDGAHLAVINSQQEAEVLNDIRRKTFEKETVHVGIRSWNREWITVQGQSLEEAGYSKWHKGEPNNDGGVENCGSMYENVKDLDDGVLNDVPCDGPRHFICEIESPKEAKDVNTLAKKMWR
ncbi:hypothetical protein ABMA28_014641 [Loxostege sticticalis]|uniref:C-type lectin domain-containing protein n=1 Tax=Loxostege sticticalis TaxID=481309 RepID=A0ABD0TC43_LOXSC